MQDAFPTGCGTALRLRGLSAMQQPTPQYVPPDPTVIEDKPEALRYWAGALESDEQRIRSALRKVGPLVEDVKHELGSYGAG